MPLKYPSGSIILPYGVSVDKGTLLDAENVTNTFYFTPFYIESTTAVNGFTVAQSGTNGMVVGLTLGLWAAALNRTPGKFLHKFYQGTTTVTSTEASADELAIIPFTSHTIEPGVYYVGCRYTAASNNFLMGRVSHWPENNWILTPPATTSANVPPIHYYQTNSGEPKDGSEGFSVGAGPALLYGLRAA